MWIFFALGSALFAGLTSVLAKCGIRKTDSTVATAIRTGVVLLFSWGMVFLVGSQRQLGTVDGKTLLFLILSGLATGASWLCYFRALQLGNLHKVVPIDKSSTVLTILLAAVLLHEGISLQKAGGMLLLAVGTLAMLKRPVFTGTKATDLRWLWYALGSALFASLTAILGKIGISGVESNLGTAIRTGVVLIMSWGMVFLQGKQAQSRAIPRNELFFICLSGLATGASWLCLLQSPANRPGQRGRSHRQAQHSCNNCLLPRCVSRAPVPQGCGGACLCCGRNTASHPRVRSGRGTKKAPYSASIPLNTALLSLRDTDRFYGR